MVEVPPTKAQQIARAAIAFQKECTGLAPESVTVLMGEQTVVVTLHKALSKAEKQMSATPEGAARVQEYHRQLFQSCSAELHVELKRILGVDVRESNVELEPSSGRLVEVFPTGDVVQVFRLSENVAAQTWSSPANPETSVRK